MMRGRKGQITLLVIIGLIILISVSLILYLQNQAIDRELQAQVDESVNDFLELNSINFYVKSCLDKVSAQGLTLLSEQGGVIYDYQGGLYPTNISFIEGLSYMPYNFTYEVTDENNNSINKSYLRNITYVIKDYVSCPASYISPIVVNFSNEQTSFYPAKQTYLKDFVTRYGYPYTALLNGCNGLSQRTSLMSGYLGGNYLPKLCSYNGSNAANTTDYSCASHMYDSAQEPFSIQRQLEYYIKQNLPDCIDFSYYTHNISGYNITVDQNNTEIQATFQNPRGILVKATYPFTISLDQKAPIIRKVDFQTTLDVNVKKLYTYVYDVLRYMTRVPGYNLTQMYQTTRGYVSSITVDVEEGACASCSNPRNFNDDLVTFTDYSSILKGKPFSFSFAIKQRKPVLDYLHDETQASFLFGKPLDYLYFTNATITIDPKAIDPDEDNITYNYSGWKETYDQWFNSTECKQAQDDYKNCYEPGPMVPFCGGPTCSGGVCPGCNLSNHLLYMKNISIQPRNWTNSSQFIATNRTAQLATNESDIGYHEVIVSVMDEHGAMDFQIVKFLIFDLPIARLTGKNNYSDVNDSFASVEDSYYLNGSLSQASLLVGGSLSQYIYKDYEEPFHYNTTESWIELPFRSFSFSNITEEVFSNFSLYPYLPNRLHKILLIVAQDTGQGIIYSAPAQIETTVAQCLVHDYDNTTLRYPNPNIATNTANKYHWSINPIGNYFDAPHVCCNPTEPTLNSSSYGGGTYFSSAHSCLQIDSSSFETCFPLDGDYEYIKRSLVDINTSTVLPLNETNYDLFSPAGNYYDDLFPDYYDPNNLYNNVNNFNNVYNVKYEQFCSGVRGNSCGGKIDAVWTKTDCTDITLPSSINQFARCQGPDTTYNLCVGKNYLKDTGSHLSCENYAVGESFEKTFIGDFSKLQTLGYDSTDVTLIMQGYCAEEEYVGVELLAPNNELFDSLTSYSSSSSILKPFACEGTCDGTGSCSYLSLHTGCECETSNSCDGVSAADLFTFTGGGFVASKAKFVCKTSNACAHDCTEKSFTSTPEGCYCDVYGSGTTYEVLNSTFQNFFDSTNYQTTISGNYCCPDSTTSGLYITRNTVAPQLNTCFKGFRKGDDQRFSSSSPGTTATGDMLSCEGDLIYCCGATTVGCSVPNSIAMIKKASVLLPNNNCGRTCATSGMWN